MARTKRLQRPHDQSPKYKPASPDASLQDRIEERLSGPEPEVEVLAVEHAGSRRSPKLCVYLDRPGGVDLALCARVTHHLRDLLAEYTVEVSSPGPERPLSRLEHYQRYLGSRVRVRTHEPIEGRSDFKGDLVGADEEGVSLAADWGMVRIPLSSIRRSNLIPQPEASRRTS